MQIYYAIKICTDSWSLGRLFAYDTFVLPYTYQLYHILKHPLQICGIFLKGPWYEDPKEDNRVYEKLQIHKYTHTALVPIDPTYVIFMKSPWYEDLIEDSDGCLTFIYKIAKTQIHKYFFLQFPFQNTNYRSDPRSGLGPIKS